MACTHTETWPLPNGRNHLAMPTETSYNVIVSIIVRSETNLYMNVSSIGDIPVIPIITVCPSWQAQAIQNHQIEVDFVMNKNSLCWRVTEDSLRLGFLLVSIDLCMRWVTRAWSHMLYLAYVDWYYWMQFVYWCGDIFVLWSCSLCLVANHMSCVRNFKAYLLCVEAVVYEWRTWRAVVIRIAGSCSTILYVLTCSCTWLAILCTTCMLKSHWSGLQMRLVQLAAASPPPASAWNNGTSWLRSPQPHSTQTTLVSEWYTRCVDELLQWIDKHDPFFSIYSHQQTCMLWLI